MSGTRPTIYLYNQGTDYFRPDPRWVRSLSFRPPPTLLLVCTPTTHTYTVATRPHRDRGYVQR